MKDLSAVSGLPVRLLDDGRLEFGPEVEVAEFLVRPIRALADVVLDRPACEAAPEGDIAYYMYNGVALADDLPKIEGSEMRYELTSIPARTIGRELVKTLGHRHTVAPGSNLAYAEVCEIIHGVAHFVFQKASAQPGEAEAAGYIEAKVGEKVLIPPDLLHLTINPGKETLVFGDVVSVEMSGIYDEFKAAHGACYVEVLGDSAARFIPNPTYTSVPELARVDSLDFPGLGITRSVPLYRAFLEHWPEWAFLHRPDLFWTSLPGLKSAFDF